MDSGSSVNVSAITLSPHAGTHADTPLHVTRGAVDSASLSISALRGPAIVLDVSAIAGGIEIAEIDWRLQHLQNADLPNTKLERLLLRTDQSIASGAFPEHWPTLSHECAMELVARGLLLLGVDCPSVDQRESKALDVHHALLGAGANVLENLDLSRVAPGEYTLVALPMKVDGLDAAPVRAILLR